MRYGPLAVVAAFSVLLTTSITGRAQTPGNAAPIGRVTAAFGVAGVHSPAGDRTGDLHTLIQNGDRIQTNGGGVTVLLASRVVLKVDHDTAVTVHESPDHLNVILERGTVHVFVGRRPLAAGPVCFQDPHSRAETSNGVFLASYDPATKSGYYACEHSTISVVSNSGESIVLGADKQVAVDNGALSPIEEIDRGSFNQRKQSLERLGQVVKQHGIDTFRQRTRIYDTQLALNQLSAAGWLDAEALQANAQQQASKKSSKKGEKSSSSESSSSSDSGTAPPTSPAEQTTPPPASNEPGQTAPIGEAPVALAGASVGTHAPLVSDAPFGLEATATDGSEIVSLDPPVTIATPPVTFSNPPPSPAVQTDPPVARLEIVEPLVVSPPPVGMIVPPVNEPPILALEVPHPGAPPRLELGDEQPGSSPRQNGAVQTPVRAPKFETMNPGRGPKLAVESMPAAPRIDLDLTPAPQAPAVPKLELPVALAPVAPTPRTGLMPAPTPVAQLPPRIDVLPPANVTDPTVVPVIALPTAAPVINLPTEIAPPPRVDLGIAVPPPVSAPRLDLGLEDAGAPPVAPPVIVPIAPVQVVPTPDTILVPVLDPTLPQLEIPTQTALPLVPLNPITGPLPASDVPTIALPTPTDLNVPVAPTGTMVALPAPTAPKPTSEVAGHTATKTTSSTTGTRRK